MTNCDRCGGYVSSDYVRVFGDNQNRIDSCPDCRTNRTERTNEATNASEEPERGLTFRMSEFETNEERESDAADASRTAGRGRFGRVSAAVSELF